MSSQEVLRCNIGIEVEAFIEIKGSVPETGSQKDFANLLASTFNKGLPQNQRQLAVNWGQHPGHKPNDPTHKDKWIVTDDASLPDDKTKNGWALEFISKIYPFEDNSTWRKEVIAFWKRLLEIGEVSTSNACATHVHISPQNEGGSWSLDQLKQVAQAVVYFEQAFEVIVAPSRRGNDHVFRNKANNHFLTDLYFEQCCTRIQACGDVDQLILAIQPLHFVPENGSPDIPRKGYAWNFINTKKGGVGTIEFRCAPGVLSGEHCLVWVEVAVSFVQAAAQYGTEKTFKAKEFSDKDVASLLKFISKASVKDMNKLELLSVVFDGCEGTKEPSVDLKKPEEEGVDVDTEMRAKFDERIKKLPKSVFM